MITVVVFTELIAQIVNFGNYLFFSPGHVTGLSRRKIILPF